MNAPLSEAKLETLEVCHAINPDLCGKLTLLEQGYAEVILNITSDMLANEQTAHLGFVHNAASYAALCANNKKNSIILQTECKFLAPISLNQEILLKARAQDNKNKKTQVRVEGFLLDIKIFEGSFEIVIFDKELFKLPESNS